MRPGSRYGGAITLAFALQGCVAAPEVDLQMESAAAAEVEVRYVRAVNEGDLDAVVRLHAPDARVVSAGSPTVRGHAAIREHFARLLAAPGIEVSATSEAVRVSADAGMAVNAGRFRFAVEGREGPVRGTGRYLRVLGKIDGEWKIVESMDHSVVE